MLIRGNTLASFPASFLEPSWHAFELTPLSQTITKQCCLTDARMPQPPHYRVQTGLVRS